MPDIDNPPIIILSIDDYSHGQARYGRNSIKAAIVDAGDVGVRPPCNRNALDFNVKERPTVQHMLKVLNAEGMIFREPSTKRYFLGHLIFQLGLVAAQKFKLHELCAPSLRRLADITHDTAFLFVRAGMGAICIGRIQGDHRIQTPSIPLGGRQALGVSAGGLALLSALPDKDVENITKANERYLDEYGGLTKAELSRLVKETRRNNYAVIGERAVPGVTAVGIAIRNQAADFPLAALAVATTTERMSKARQKEIVPILQEEAARVTELLNQ